MSSEAKINANRSNSLKSTGPITHSGKRHSRMNAVRTGVYARTIILPGENSASYEKIRDAVFSELRPQGIIQKMLANQIAADIWRLIRLDRAERTYLEDRLIVHAFLREEAEGIRDCTVGFQEGEEGYYDPNALDEKLPQDWRKEVKPNAKDVSAVLARTVIAANDRKTTAVIEARRRGLLRDVQRNLRELRELQKEQVVPLTQVGDGSQTHGAK